MPLCLSCHVHDVTALERQKALVDFINDSLNSALDPAPDEDAPGTPDVTRER